MKSDRLGHAVDGEVAENIAALWAGLFYASALERHLREFLYIKKFRAAQMIVSLFDARIDAPYIDLRRNGGILWMLTIDLDPAVEFREFSMRGPQKLVHAETDRRAGWIKPVGVVRQQHGAQARD